MPRRARQTPGIFVYHVINRAVGRMDLFRRDKDYEAMVKVVLQAHEKHPMRILGFCLMPNHWHFVLWPRNDGDLSRFMFWLTMTHTMRWRHARKLVGLGPLYQGRFKTFPVETDRHLLTVLRYVERNPLRANLVARAQDWKYGSLAARLSPASEIAGLMHPWPIAMPEDYLELVNRPQTPAEEEALRTSIRRSRPYGDAAWQIRTARELGLEASLRPPGRPPKPETEVE